MNSEPKHTAPTLLSSPEATRSRTLCPDDHLKTLIELIKPAGADLARRLVAALMLVPEDERETIVSSIESKLVEMYDTPGAVPEDETLLHISDEPVEKDGYVEQVIRSYASKARAGRSGAPGRGVKGQG